ncbi:hypothetical protein PybrP1_003559 [[Pythium] brassicae (nom. inval.)]|nr:hypothetical protein PybrP1_003559 [[Pythium] brassicae (nom. inval.)]
MTSGLSSHSVRRDAAAYANASLKLAIQWISTCGAWLLDSPTKAFAYVGTTTREDQCVNKVLAGFRDPDLPCTTPTIRFLKERIPETEYAQVLAFRNQLFRNVTGFDDTSLNVAPDVLDAALASPLIHLQDVCDAVAREQDERNFTAYYYYRIHEAIASTNSALGTSLPLKRCHVWGEHLVVRLEDFKFRAHWCRRRRRLFDHGRSDHSDSCIHQLHREQRCSVAVSSTRAREFRVYVLGWRNRHWLKQRWAGSCLAASSCCQAVNAVWVLL